MSALYDVADLSVDLALPRDFLGMLLPGPKPKLNLLKGISLTLNRGETFGLVGESGSGKTTLARSMLGLLPISGGQMAFEGAPLTSPGSFIPLRRKVAMMFQDATASLSPRMTVGALLAEPFHIHSQPLPDPDAMAAALLARVGLPAAIARRFPHELSGGQARRVGVARALALNPALVIADEPTAGLDVSVQGEVLNLMTALKADHGLSLMIITHNLAMVRHVSDRIAILYLGRLMETGPTRAVFARPAHPYTQSLIASEPQPDPRKRRTDLAIHGEIPSVLNRPAGCAFHSRCPRAAALCRQTTPELRDLGQGRAAACHFADLT